MSVTPAVQIDCLSTTHHGTTLLGYLDKSKYFPRGVVGVVSGSEVFPCLLGESYVEDVYDLVEDWDVIAPSLRRGKPSEPWASVQIQAPLVSRDVIGIAKNFRDHPK